MVKKEHRKNLLRKIFLFFFLFFLFGFTTKLLFILFRSHILSLQTKPENVNKTYQLCDIHFESLQEIITSLSHVDTKCTVTFYSFSNFIFKKIIKNN